MKVVLVILIILSKLGLSFAQNAIDTNYTIFLKKRVSWEVQEYDKNIFKNWLLSDLRSILGDRHTVTADEENQVGGLESITVPQNDVVDWSQHKCSHSIPFQGKCGGCWAFTVASMVSDRCCLNGEDHGWLSVQELISCEMDSNGCIEGSRNTGVEYVQKNGLVPESCYPYVERTEACPDSCVDGSDWSQAHVCKCRAIKKCTGEKNLMQCLNTGPVAGGMAVYADFLYYKGGVYSWDKNAALLGYHSVKIVGYGPDFWKCANSWGKNWGMEGYFLIARGECELETRSPIFCDPIP